MDANEKRTIINEIGMFIPGKKRWLEYHENMERCFEDRFVDNEYRKELCIASLGANSVKFLKGIIKPQKIQDLDYKTIVDKLEKHFYPNPNRQYYLTKFMVRKQRRDESFFKYVSNLRELLQHCNLGEAAYGKLRDQLTENTTGIVKLMLERELMKEATIPTLSKVFCKGLEIDNKFFLRQPISRRNKKKPKKIKGKKCFRCNLPLVPSHENVTCPFDWGECESCEMPGHLVTACKYRDVKCNKCGVIGHVAKICKGQKGLPSTQTNAAGAAVEGQRSASLSINEVSNRIQSLLLGTNRV